MTLTNSRLITMLKHSFFTYTNGIYGTPTVSFLNHLESVQDTKLNMIRPLSVSQQYLLASKARSKLMKCANTGKNKDFDLRILVGHANMLDKLMDSIEKFNSKDNSGSYGVEYISSEGESDEENRAFSTDSSSEEESDVEDDDSSEDEQFTSQLRAAMVTVTIDHCLEDGDEYESDSESDVDEQSFEMDLSMMPLAFKSRDVEMTIHEPIIV
ncbi:hypothetical protein HG537_0B03720 [Torulaspora globosa]|uniref:Uncharacterized protein n=1 Tax=Torulaspora globosa TaxID=48254 RepID=A0A7H9HRP3_9SACH|nr:hypothetical protein HG537_0B03720 [Torulaspora sp. CBS 2947]